MNRHDSSWLRRLRVMRARTKKALSEHTVKLAQIETQVTDMLEDALEGTGWYPTYTDMGSPGMREVVRTTLMPIDTGSLSPEQVSIDWEIPSIAFHSVETLREAFDSLMMTQKRGTTNAVQ